MVRARLLQNNEFYEVRFLLAASEQAQKDSSSLGRAMRLRPPLAMMLLLGAAKRRLPHEKAFPSEV